MIFIFRRPQNVQIHQKPQLRKFDTKITLSLAYMGKRKKKEREIQQLKKEKKKKGKEKLVFRKFRKDNCFLKLLLHQK